MSDIQNPFFYQSASDLHYEDIKNFYSETSAITPLLLSKNNCYVVGERGAGKTMALLYHAYPIQKQLYREKQPPIAGIYIPCITPLFQKNEASLLSKEYSLATAEHFINLAIVSQLCESLKQCCTLPDQERQENMLEIISYMLALDDKIPFYRNIFESLQLFITRKTTLDQKELNKAVTIGPEVTYTFFTFTLPILNIFSELEELNGAHFSFFIDDAHMLSHEQKKVFNSYISFRDHSLFSFKIAISACEDYHFKTIGNTTINEGHDFTVFNMGKEFQSKNSDFGRLLRSILKKRLEQIEIFKTPDEFFPEADSLKECIEIGNEKARQEAIKKYGEAETKKISDHIYKYGRAYCFASRDPKAGMPQYSGLDTIAHISTGIIREALRPCHIMFDQAYTQTNRIPDYIEGHIQAEVLIQQSEQLWQRIEKGFENRIEGCTKDDSRRIHNFFTILGDSLVERLKSDKSEPRVLAFTVSETESPEYEKVQKLLTLCRKALLIFERIGPAKEKSRRKPIYATNRLLWVCRGLDPNGQHGRLSLKASDIWEAAENGKKFPTNSEVETSVQYSLF